MRHEIKIRFEGKEKVFIHKTREDFAPTQKPMKKKNSYQRKEKHKKDYSQE